MSEKVKASLYFLAIYVSMVLGMTAKTLFDHYTRGTNLDFSRFIIPLLVSPLVFGFVFNGIKNSSSEPILIVIFGFQNGFFWQDVFGQIADGSHTALTQGGHP